MSDEAERRSALLFPRQRKILAAMGENIKLARKRRQFTQKLVSERAGISPVTLRKVEKGDANVAVGHYLNVLAVLQLADDLGQVALQDELGRTLQDIKLLGGSTRKDQTKPPVGNTWDSFFLSPDTVSDDFMAERASQEQQERESF